MTATPATLTFSNPRLSATFEDWPSGSQRVRCTFQVEHHPKRGYRIARQTTGKPKYSTYGGPSAIVDGSDGRTYLLVHIPLYQMVKVRRSDFLDAERGCVWSQDADYASLLALIAAAV